MSKNIDLFKSDLQKVADSLNRVRFAARLHNTPQCALNNPSALLKLNGRGEYEVDDATLENNKGSIPGDYSPVL